MNSLIATTENCRYCLMCRHVAPVGLVTHNEALTPHGVALVVASQRRGLLQWDDKSVAILYSEPDAGNCRAHCVTDQPLPAAIAAVRAQVVQDGLAPTAAYEIHDRLTEARSVFGTFQPSNGQSDTVLFVGDEGHNLSPSTAEAALKLLEAAGIQSVPVGIGLGSGYFASSLGFPSLAKELALQCIDEIQKAGARRVVVLSPKEVFTFRQLYPERLGIAWPKDIELVDLASLLAGALTDQILNVAPDITMGPAAYVDPTHAVRVPERFDAARALTGSVLGRQPIELFWRRDRAHPVGSTGLQFTRPDIAKRLTMARLEDALQQGSRTLICDDPATLHALAELAPTVNIRVVGLYEALVKALR